MLHCLRTFDWMFKSISSIARFALPFWTLLATSSSSPRMNACLSFRLASANACMRASTWNCTEPDTARVLQKRADHDVVGENLSYNQEESQNREHNLNRL